MYPDLGINTDLTYSGILFIVKMIITNDKLDLARDFVLKTGKNIFLTGKAGTGKTTFLQSLRQKPAKRMVVVAPTGVAAINAGGMTIHSFFQLPFGPIVPGGSTDSRIIRENGTPFKRRFTKEKLSVIKNLDLLVIDEISMVRADLLDGIDDVLRQYRNRRLPFGGVQLLMIGDLQQLAPVVKDEEWEILRKYYETAFFYSSRALARTDYISIQLDHVFRQSDPVFLELLNKVRDNRADPSTLEQLNKRYIPGFIEEEHPGYIILTTHNAHAQEINLSRLKSLPGKSSTFTGTISGDFPPYSYPTEVELELKTGAQIMFVKNDHGPDRRFHNGKIGIIEAIEDEIIYVKCENEDYLIETGREEWQNVNYSLDQDTGEIKETLAGSFTQYPLKLAWAITIHKSQGLTFEKAIIDASAAFAHGQVYVALSRCKSLEGMVLNTSLTERCFINSSQVSGFTERILNNQPRKEHLLQAEIEYRSEKLKDLFDFQGILFQLTHCYGIAEGHATSLEGPLPEDLRKIVTGIQANLMPVSKSFNRQLERLLETGDECALQERVSKASRWFYEQLDELLFPAVKGLWVETDNREVKKTLDQSIDRLTRDIWVKSKCLRSCYDGFDIEVYLKTMVSASVEPQEKRRKPTKEAKAGHSDLYKELIRWRNARAKERNVAVYRVLPLKTIAEISQRLPVGKRELKTIKGFGDKKIREFGEEVLKIVETYI